MTWKCQPKLWQIEMNLFLWPENHATSDKTVQFSCTSIFSIFLGEVQSPNLDIAADPSQVEQPDQEHIWCLQLEIFFDKFFQAADNLEMIKNVQSKKS